MVSGKRQTLNRCRARGKDQAALARLEYLNVERDSFLQVTSSNGSAARELLTLERQN